ncbi:MAG: hypothetical protein ACHQRJ_23740 [Alphaproteobacteria bacterium]
MWIPLAAFIAVVSFAIPGIAQVPDVTGVCVMYCGGGSGSSGSGSSGSYHHNTPSEPSETPSYHAPSQVYHPHAHRGSDGQWHPDDGYRWANDDEDDFSVVWVPGLRSYQYPHVIASTEENRFTTEDGYDWIVPNPQNSGVGVRWVPNKRSVRYPNILTSAREGEWHPEDGYSWLVDSDLGDLRVKWVPNMWSRIYPHVLTADTEGRWKAADGYSFVDPNHNLGVKWNPGIRSSLFPHVYTSKTQENIFYPEAGYVWVEGSLKWTPDLGPVG